MSFAVKKLIMLTSFSLGLGLANPALAKSDTAQAKAKADHHLAIKTVEHNSDTRMLIAADFDRLLPDLKNQVQRLHQAKAAQNTSTPALQKDMTPATTKKHAAISIN